MVLRMWRLQGVSVPGVEVLSTSFRQDVKLVILLTIPFMESVHTEKEGKQIWESTFRRTQVTHAHTSTLLFNLVDRSKWSYGMMRLTKASALSTVYKLVEPHISSREWMQVGGAKQGTANDISWTVTSEYWSTVTNSKLIVLPLHEDWKPDNTLWTHTHNSWSWVFANRSSGISVSSLTSRFLWT